MKLILMVLIIALVISLLAGCAVPPGSGTSPSSPTTSTNTLTEQQILEQHPDGLDSALTDLDIIE